MSMACQANSERISDSASFQNKVQSERIFRSTAHSDFPEIHKCNKERWRTFFTMGAITVIAGFLLPLPPHILDVLLIFSTSLTAAMLIITFSATTALQVQGFPLLIVLATMLRIALSTTSAKLILSHGDAGTIVGLFGSILVRNNCVLAILVFGTLTLLIFGAICKAVRNINKTAADFNTDIVPIKKIGIDNNLITGIIDNSQVISLQEKFARQAYFFISMASAAKFLLCAAVIELAIVTANIIASMAVGTATPTAEGISVKTYATLVVGSGMITQISALLTAVASEYLVRKSSMNPADNAGLTEKEYPERTGVLLTEVTPANTTELPYDNSVNYAGEKGNIADIEWFDETTSDENKKDKLNLWIWDEIKDGDCYQAIAELINAKSDDAAKMVLMAAESIEELPVTISVNIAIHLAKKGRKCLLIDLDSQRNAVSKVFDIDNRKSKNKAQAEKIATAIPTCIRNLWVWPANNFAKGNENSNSTNTKQAIASLKGQFDRLIIYAPNVKLPADLESIVGCIQTAMLFGSKSKSGNYHINKLCKFLNGCGCTILKPDQAFAQTIW